jgi:hypothetical protein
MADFAELKKRITLEQVFSLLSIPMKRTGKDNLRGNCPFCGCSGERGFSATPSKDLVQCFGKCNRKGWDIISLYSDIKKCSLKQAGDELDAHFAVHTTAKELDYLVFNEHVPLTEEDAQEVGIGYAPKGTLRGMVAVPLRRADGTIVRYMGIPVGTEVKIGKKFGGT